jgi:putative transposase
VKRCEKSGDRTGATGLGAVDAGKRRALQVVRMSASALRYEPRPDRNAELRARIIGLAQRHRRYGAEMIYLKLRQAGEPVNHKRVERLYTLEGLQVRRRRRKKIPVSDRQPLIRPGAANEVWSMDFVFDRVADGRVIKCLVIVDDATHEAVAIVPEHSIGGDHLTRLLDAICVQPGKPLIIRSDNGKEFTGKAMLTWAHSNAVTLKLIEPRKPNRNAYVESFNGTLRRMPERTMVHQPGTCPYRNRTLAVPRGACRRLHLNVMNNTKKPSRRIWMLDGSGTRLSGAICCHFAASS